MLFLNSVVIVGEVTDVTAVGGDYEVKLSTGEPDPIVVVVAADEPTVGEMRPGGVIAVRGKVAMRPTPVNGVVVPLPAVRCDRQGLMMIRGQSPAPAQGVAKPSNAEPSPSPMVGQSGNHIAPAPHQPEAPKPSPQSAPAGPAGMPNVSTPSMPAATPSFAPPQPTPSSQAAQPTPAATGPAQPSQPANEKPAMPAAGGMPQMGSSPAPSFGGPLTAPQPSGSPATGGLGRLNQMKPQANQGQTDPANPTDERTLQPSGPDRLDDGVPF